MERAEEWYEISITFGGLARKDNAYYINSMSLENEGPFQKRLSEYKNVKAEGQEGQDEMPPKSEQTKLSAFFDY